MRSSAQILSGQMSLWAVLSLVRSFRSHQHLTARLTFEFPDHSGIRDLRWPNLDPLNKGADNFALCQLRREMSRKFARLR
jgi:hypothetical protein